MDFSTAQEEVSSQLGLDKNSTSDLTLIKRWLNFSYKSIARGHVNAGRRWSWLKDLEVITTATDYTTGTVSATVASTTITFSAVIAASQSGKYIQFSSTNDWYKISTHTAGANTATLETAYAQTSNLTAGTYTIRTFYYSLSSSAEYIYSARQSISPCPLAIINAMEYDINVPYSDATGNPTTLYLWGLDSSGNMKVQLFPTPDAKMLIEFRTYKKITELSADGDTPLFPQGFDDIWIKGALVYGYRFMDDDRDKSLYAEFLSDLREMMKQDKQDLGRIDVISNIDFPNYRNRAARFPSNFDERYGV